MRALRTATTLLAALSLMGGTSMAAMATSAETERSIDAVEDPRVATSQLQDGDVERGAETLVGTIAEEHRTENRPSGSPQLSAVSSRCTSSSVL